MVIDFLLNVFSEAGQLFLESSVYMLFGFLVAGAIHGYFPESKISKYLGRRNWRSVLNASLIGIPLPLCSCAVLPTAIALRRNGASRGSTLAFLISTPETGVDSIGVSFALLDPILAIVRPIAAFLTALIAGIGANVME